jgi:hypothetical protein
MFNVHAVCAKTRAPFQSNASFWNLMVQVTTELLLSLNTLLDLGVDRSHKIIAFYCSPAGCSKSLSERPRAWLEGVGQMPGRCARAA